MMFATRELRRSASAPWLLLIHGLQSNRELFHAAFSDSRLGRFSILAINLPGFGDTPAPERFDFDLDSQCDAVVEQLHQRGVREVHCVGHSLGGMIGTRLAERFPGLVRTLISLEGNLSLEDCGESKRVDALSWDDFCREYYPDLKRRLAATGTAGAKSRLNALEQISGRAFYETCRSIVRWSKAGQLKRAFETARCPRLLLIGEHGTYHSRPSGPALSIEAVLGAGHFMLHDAPEETWSRIISFLDREGCCAP